MKQLTEEEVQDRINALSRSQRMFASVKNQTCPKCGHEYKGKFNLTEIFAAYQNIFAEREREIQLLARKNYKKANFLDKYERPKCPKCGRPMEFLPYLDRLTPQQNPKGWKTAWQCPGSTNENDSCFYQEFSHHSLQWWIMKLKKRKESKNG